jgi:hypothetical protein
MIRWLNTVELTIPDVSREQDFINWYSSIHLPDVLECPGFKNGRLYIAKEFRDGRGKFLTTYEIESDDIDQTMTIRREMREQEKKRGRYGNTLDYIHQIWRDVLWREIARMVVDKEHDPNMGKWVNLIETNCVDPSLEQEFNDWYTNIHLPDILETPGFMAAKRYEMKELRDGRGKYFTVYEIETNDIDKTMEVRRKKRKREGEQGRQRNNLWTPVWGDVLWRVIIERSIAK